MIGRITELNLDCELPSTNLAESTDAVIRVCADDDKAEGISATINEAQWCALGDHDGKSLDKCKGLDEEALMLYHFIEQTTKENVKKSLKMLHQTLQNQTSQHGSHRQKQKVEKNVEKKEKIAKMKANEQALQKKVAQETQHQPRKHSPPKQDSDKTNFETEHSTAEDEDPELDRMFQAWHKLLNEHKVDEIKKICKGTVLVNMIDIGGQPPFLEMSPVLTIGSALYLVFFDLRQELNEQKKVRYVWDSSTIEPDTTESKKHQYHNRKSFELPYTYSVTEVVFQILSSIACFSVETEAKELKSILPPPTQSVSLVGTFLDEAGKETCSERENQISGEVDYLDKVILGEEEKPYQKYLYCLDGENYILAVNNAGGSDEICKHRKHLEKMIHERFEEFPIPASWLMFSVLLRKLNKDVVSIEQCEKIAKRAFVKKSQLKHVLWFLHHRTGVIMYYGEVKELQDVVICNPAVIFDCISDLILKTFLPMKCYNPRVRDKFWKYGQFFYDDIKSANTVSNLSTEGVIALLNHLNVLVEVTVSSKKAYFMHAVLQAASDSDLQQLWKENEKVAPLIIRFKSGFVPVGCFSTLIALILKSKSSSAWTWELQTENELFKNKITFLLAGTFNVTLVSCVKHYEVHIQPVVEQSDYNLPLWEACRLVLRTVCGALDSVLLQLKQKFMYTSCEDLTRYQIGFICSRTECQSSLDKQLQLENHCMVLRSGYQISLDQSCTCLRTKKNVCLKHEHHLVWSGQVYLKFFKPEL